MPTNRLEFSKQREEDCKAPRIKTKSDQDSLKFFEELGMKLVHYTLDPGLEELEKLPLWEAEVFALPSPWWIYFEPEGQRGARRADRCTRKILAYQKMKYSLGN